jgi:hypothetical protein
MMSRDQLGFDPASAQPERHVARQGGGRQVRNLNAEGVGERTCIEVDPQGA